MPNPTHPSTHRTLLVAALVIAIPTLATILYRAATTHTVEPTKDSEQPMTREDDTASAGEGDVPPPAASSSTPAAAAPPSSNAQTQAGAGRPVNCEQAAGRRWACRCLNVRITRTTRAPREKAQQGDAPGAGEHPERSAELVHVVPNGLSVVHPQLVARIPLTLNCIGMYPRRIQVRCLNCHTDIYSYDEPTYGPQTTSVVVEAEDVQTDEDGQVWVGKGEGVLVDNEIDDARKDPSYSQAFDILTSPPGVPTPPRDSLPAPPIPSAPVDLPTSTSPLPPQTASSISSSPTSTTPTPAPGPPPRRFLPPRDLFMPAPFTPSDAAYARLASLAATRSAQLRQEGERRVDQFLEQVRREVEEEEEQAREQVAVIWARWRTNAKEAADHLPAPERDGRRHAVWNEINSPTASSPTLSTGGGNEPAAAAAANLSFERIASPSPSTPHVPTSMLGRSLSTSHLASSYHAARGRPTSSSPSSPLRSPSTSSSPLPSAAPGSIAVPSSVKREHAGKPPDLDVASSLMVVQEELATRMSADDAAEAARVAGVPPPPLETVQEEAKAKPEPARAESADRRSRDRQGAARKVTFAEVQEPRVYVNGKRADMEEDEVEERIDEAEAAVFDFDFDPEAPIEPETEQAAAPSSSPPASSPPSTAAPERSPSRDSAAERAAQHERDIRRAQEKLHEILAANTPSHRRAWAEAAKVRRPVLPEEEESEDEEDGEDLPFKPAFATSVPVDIKFPEQYRPPLERKTSLSDRNILVPPLVPRPHSPARAQRGPLSPSSTLPSTNPLPILPVLSSSQPAPQPGSLSARRVSYALKDLSATIDPGPVLEDETLEDPRVGEVEERLAHAGESGFVAPHLASISSFRPEEGMWRSLVNN